MARKTPNRKGSNQNNLRPSNVHAHSRKAQLENANIEEHKLYIGPIPSPEAMASFKEVDSLFPERILKLAENEASHRQKEVEKNNSVIRAEIRSDGIVRFVAPFMAFLLAGGALFLAYKAFEQGLEWAGTVISLPGVAGLIMSFYYFTKNRRH